MTAPTSSISIRTLYVTLIAGAVVAASLLVGLSVHFQSGRAAITLQMELFSHVARSVTEHISGHFDHGLALLDELVHRMETGALTFDDQDALAAYFAERLRFQDNLAWISFSREVDGCFAGAWIDRGDPVMNTSCPDRQGGVPKQFAVRIDGARQPLEALIPPYDPRQRAWYAMARDHAGPVWTGIIRFHEGRPGMTVARAVRPGGSFAGVMTVDFFTETVSHFLRSARPAASGLVFLQNGDQVILPEGISAADSNAIARASGIHMAGLGETIVVDLEGISYFLNTRRMPAVLDGQWICRVLTPRAELLALVKPHHRTMWWSTLAFSAVVLAIGLAVTARLARPLRTVSRHLRRVAEGDLQDVQNGGMSRIREVRYIQEALVHMRHALRERAAVEREKLVAEQMSRDKSEFAAMISHELRSPLQVIMGYSELMQMENRTADDASRAYADTIYNSSLELLELINNLLSLFKAEAGRFEVQRESVVLDRLVDGCVHNLMLKAKIRGIGLAVVSHAPGLTLQTDPVMLRQILTNLLTNAIKFTEQGAVTVTVERTPEGGAAIRVQDTGIGMTSEEVERIFTRFTQAHHGIARQYGGTGLGLSICLLFASMLGAELRCASKPGEGSCFTLLLPESATG